MTRSRYTSRATAYAGQALRASGAQAQRSAASVHATAIEAARENARVNSYTDPTDVVTAADAGDGTATLTMIVHTRIYPVQGNVDVPDLPFPNPVTLLGAPLGTDGFVYYDDVTLLNVNPTLVWTTVREEAQVGYAVGRHFVAEITTPAAGDPPTLPSGGAKPPGSGTALP